jgi:putative endonuclease
MGKFQVLREHNKVNRLVYFENYKDPRAAIAREKEIKGWRRNRKNALVETLNPKWADLSGALFESARGPSLRSG